MLTYAEDTTASSGDRVRRSTKIDLNEKIDRVTESNIQAYVNSSHATIEKRIQELDEE